MAYTAPGKPTRMRSWKALTVGCATDGAGETLFMNVGHAREKIAAWIKDYNVERPHSSLDYATPAAYAAGLEKQWAASLRPTGSATPPIASPAQLRDNDAEALIATG